MLFPLCWLVLASAVIFGGGTHAGYLGDVFVQLGAVPLLTAALWPALSQRNPNRQKARIGLYVGAAAAFVVLVQVLPLPFDYWSGGASLISWPSAAAFEPVQSRWATLSIAPQAAWAAAASLTVPLSIFGAVTQLGCRQRFLLAWLLLGLGALSLVAGFLQVAQGPGSSLRFYDFANQTEATGFFANRNHFAAFLYVLLLLAGLRLAILEEPFFSRETLGSRSTLWLAALAALLVAILGGLALAKSRMGLALAIIALGGILALVLRRPRLNSAPGASRRVGARRASLAAIVFGTLFAAQFGLGGILARFEADPAADLRVTFNRTAWQALPDALPFGTGLGSFVPVYAAAEKRQDVFEGYANRAHNDLAELLLETGFMGASLLLAFLAWFVRRSYTVWKQTKRNPSHLMLERTATLAILLLLVHSLVDYPLRTAALGAVFAFFCAILAVPAPDSGVAPATPKRHGRTKREPNFERSSGGRWGAGIDWPEGWQKRPDQDLRKPVLDRIYLRT